MGTGPDVLHHGKLQVAEWGADTGFLRTGTSGWVVQGRFFPKNEVPMSVPLLVCVCWYAF